MKFKKKVLAGFIIGALGFSANAQAAWYDDAWDWIKDNIAEPVVDAGKVTLDWLDTKVIEPIAGLASDVDGYISILEATMSDHGYIDAYGLDYSPATNYAQSSGSLDVITFNIKGFPEALNGISNSQARELSTIIESWGADIVGIQENWVRTDALTDNLTTATYPYRSDYWAGTPTTFGDGLLTLSPYPFSQHKVQYHEWNKCHGTLLEYLTGNVNSPDCATEKGFTLTEVEIAKDFIVHFYNLHGNTGGNEANNKSDLDQVAEMIHTYSAGSPVIIVGDFNIYFAQRDKNSHQYQQMIDFKIKTGITFTCEQPQPDGTIEGCDRIDYIGYRGNPKYQFSHIPLEDNRLDHNNISDHPPRIGKLEWINTYADQAVVDYPKISQNIALISDSGKYLVAEGNGGGTVNADRNNQGAWESFKLNLEQAKYFEGCIQSGDLISISTSEGYYFSAQSNGDLDADRTNLGSWEQFTLINHDDNSGCLENNDKISFRSAHGKYLVGENDGDAHANRSDIGPWEIFTVKF
ncbi:endonuclease/exonuclease/phosphatase family protein [Thalassomonas sp. RHCl1]|uniref:endonuclease/exonuclease/phosphatase family protein n=1 Tax=Thalassomonas sp. RHCl1 TaxID=2995320 RepID=UPI00248BAD46|nr:endonuclease/exonuclease/phosphatase family protein [Thalassomonas sp. RHCl1]